MYEENFNNKIFSKYNKILSKSQFDYKINLKNKPSRKLIKIQSLLKNIKMKNTEMSKILTSHIKNEIATTNVIKKLGMYEETSTIGNNIDINFNNKKDQYNEYIIKLLKTLNEEYIKIFQYNNNNNNNLLEDNLCKNEEFCLKGFNKNNKININFIKELLKDNDLSKNKSSPSSEFNAAEFIFSVENLPTFLNNNGILNKEAIRQYLRVICEYYGLDLNIDEKVIDAIDENIKNFI